MTTVYPSKFFNTDGTIPTKHIYAGDLLVADITGSNASASVHYVHGRLTEPSKQKPS